MKLCITAGHGGTDPGASAFGYLEKNLTLVVAQRVIELLKQFNPTLIRKDDSTFDLNDRTAVIRKGFDFCLDIHFNAGGGTGIETIHSIYSRNGKALAEHIAKGINAQIGLPIRRVFSRQGNSGDYYAMHRLTGSTCTVIVEGLFLDSANDIPHLNIEGIAQGIANGFKVFYADYSQRPVEAPKPSSMPFVHKKESLTDIIEVEPSALKISVQNQNYEVKTDKKPILARNFNLPNFITAGYQGVQGNGFPYPVSILASEGKVICNNQPHGKPAGTLIVYKDGSVDCKPLLNLNGEKDVWFAVGGCSILPKIRMAEEGFVGQFADIGRVCLRPTIGYRKSDNKVILTMRPDTNIARARETLINLGCDSGITLDGGGSSAKRVNNKMLYDTTRPLFSVITW